MTAKEKLALLEDMFEMDEGTLKATDELRSVKGWDSVTALSLLILIQENCGKVLKSEDLKNFKTIQDILDFMG